MATRGFEYAYRIDGGQGGPKVVDWPLALIDANIGDALTIDASGYGTAVATDTAEVLGILQEDTGGLIATAGTKFKVALACREHVFKCSMDATTTTAVVGYTKDIQFVDGNTIDADGATSGARILVDTGTDDAVNVLAYVVFEDTVFGNT